VAKNSKKQRWNYEDGSKNKVLIFLKGNFGTKIPQNTNFAVKS